MAYPGTISLRVNAYTQVIRDILESLTQHGFKRIVIVNGQGGNTPAQSVCGEFMRDHADARIKWHDWWNAPRVRAKVQEIDPVASHASWLENFPWTRLANVVLPREQKAPIDLAHVRQLNPREARAYLGDGSYAGVYQRSDDTLPQNHRQVHPRFRDEGHGPTLHDRSKTVRDGGGVEDGQPVGRE